MILVVDDNASDRDLLRIAFAMAGLEVAMESAKDGLDGMEKLQQAVLEGKRYSVVLIDINIPRMDGRELLEWAMTQDELAVVPMVMLTSSHSPTDRRRCLDLGASAYLTKPADFKGYEEIIRAVQPLIEGHG